MNYSLKLGKRRGSGRNLALIREKGGQGEAIRFDVADSAAAAAKMEEIISRHKDIHILVNNAGVTADGLFMMMTEENWDMVIQTTLKGFFNITKPVIQRMVRNHKGSVVSISSVSAMMGNRGQVNYAAAKSGLIAASRSLSSEVARLGVRVNVVAPGLIDTDMIKDAPWKESRTSSPWRDSVRQRKWPRSSVFSVPTTPPTLRDRSSSSTGACINNMSGTMIEGPFFSGFSG